MRKRNFKTIVVTNLQVGDTAEVAIGIQNPPVNALSVAVREELRAAFDDLDSRRDVQKVFLCGMGKHFSAGADLRELQRIAHLKKPQERAAKAFTFARHGQRLIKQVMAVSARMEVIAQMNGACTGGGLELALACSKRLLKGPSGLIGFPETTLGLIPGWGGTVLLPLTLFMDSAERHSHRARAFIDSQRAIARDLIMGGKLFTYFDAWKKYALVSLEENMGEPEEFVLPPERVVSLHARELALEAIPVCEDILCFEDGLLREAELFAKAMSHPDAREGIDAFLEKRPSKFSSFTAI